MFQSLVLAAVVDGVPPVVEHHVADLVGERVDGPPRAHAPEGSQGGGEARSVEPLGVGFAWHAGDRDLAGEAAVALRWVGA